jgi:hypothetical protein
MADRADRPTVQTEPGKHLVDAGEETLRRVGGSRRRLGRREHSAALVDGDDISKRAAGVDSYPDVAGHLDPCR